METKKLSKEDIVKFLYENCYNKDWNVVVLANLDFTPFDCDIDLSHMKVTGSLFQEQHQANIITQDNQKTITLEQGLIQADEIDQSFNKAKEINQEWTQSKGRIIIDKLSNFNIKNNGRWKIALESKVNNTQPEKKGN